MLNWLQSPVWEKFKDVVRPDDEIDMPEMATEAFTIVREGKKFKVRLMDSPHKLQAYQIHESLYERGFNDLPKPCGIEEVGDKKFSFVEWLPGKTFWELFHEGNLAEDDFYRFGLWLGLLHKETYRGLKISFLNYFHKNLFKTSSGEVIHIDLGKLYLTRSPWAFIDKYIITEDIVSFPQREAFLAGYRRNSNYDIKKVIEWHCREIYSKYHDIFLHGEPFWRGSMPVKKRIDMMGLPKDMAGMRVLDLGCSGGGFSLECALRGAKYVYGCDTEHRNIQLGPTLCHHRLSDMTKLIAYFHGFDGRDLHFKHIQIDSDWFIEEHLKFEPKWDIIFCLGLMEHIAPGRREKLMRRLSDCTDLLYYQGHMDEGEIEIRRWLQGTTKFTDYVHLGKVTDHSRSFTYHLFKCQRRRRQAHEICREVFKTLFSPDLPLRGIEIGSCGGSWTFHILTHFPNLEVIYCIDPWKHFENGFYEQTNSQEVHDTNYKHFLQKVSSFPGKTKALRMTSHEALEYIKGPVDFVFIDGCHQEEFVKKDIENYWPLVRKGGFFGGHDYGLASGVTKQVDEHFPEANKEEDYVWWVRK